MKNFFYALVGSAALLSCSQSKQPMEEQASAEVKVTAPPPAELSTDQKYADLGKAGLAALASGDVATWMNSFADNARYLWSGGDSLVGKKAISDYWMDRRGKVIDKLVVKNDIWYTLKINQSQKEGHDRTGIWLLNWFQVESTYKNGATVKMWIHNDMHFDANDKIDVMVQYIDRAPIAAAMAKKK